MDAQELRSLQEAYNQVHQVDEVKTATSIQMEEHLDLFDLVKGYLLDEGYAETPEAAEAIMVNMSEEWRESIAEQVNSGFVGVTKRFGGGFGSGNVGVNASVGGSRGGTNFNASGSLERGKFSDKGGKIETGVSNAIRNFNTGSNANTSTSNLTQGTRGSLTANVSGGSVAKPKPNPINVVEKPRAKPNPINVVEKPRAQPQTPKTSALPSQSDARWDLAKRGLVDDRGNPYPGSVQHTGTHAGENPDPKIRAQAQKDYPVLRGLEQEFRQERENRSTGVRRNVINPDGSVGLAPR